MTMANIRTIPMNRETYNTLIRIANHGFYLSIINTVMMLLLSIWTKPVEVSHYGSYEITEITNTTPLYVSLFLHLVAILFFKVAYRRIIEANIQRVFKTSKRSCGESDLEMGDDFSKGKESLIAVLEPIGSDSNQWFIFLGIGLALSIIGVSLGVSSAILVAIPAAIPELMDTNVLSYLSTPKIVLSVAVAVPQLFTIFKVVVQYLIIVPHISQHSVEATWPEQFRKALEWRLGKKVQGQQIEHDGSMPIPWKVKLRSARKMTVCVRLSAKEAYCYIMQHLNSSKATIIRAEPCRIMAEHGKWIAWEPKDAKKKITVCINKLGKSSSEISVNVRLSKIDRFLTWLTAFLGVAIVLVSYRFDEMLGNLIAAFFVIAFVPLMIWDFFEKDAVARDLLYRFYRDGLLDIEMIEVAPHRKGAVEKLERLITILVSRIDDFYRIVFGGGIIRERDFPFMPIYRFRDYRSNIHQYGKTAASLGKEGREYDFADATSRKQSEVQLAELGGYCRAEYDKEILAERIVNPTKVLENLRIFGRPGTAFLAGPWASLIVIGLGILLFVLSFDDSIGTVSKTEFVCIAAFGIWILAATMLILLFENSSTWVHTSESLKTLLSFGLFPLVIGFLYFCLSDGTYSLKPSMYLWSLAAVVLGVTIAPHTSGKPFSRSLYFYIKDTKSNHFSYMDKEKDTPYWLDVDAKYYWVFRFVLQWLWEMTLPYPHRDSERIEIWVNAETGKPEWAVTDYHYRELWYEIPIDSKEIIIWWDSNFHTFHPIVDKDLVRLFRNSKRSEGLSGFKLDNEYKKRSLEVSKKIAEAHHVEKVSKFFKGFEKLGAKECARLPWKYWRYPFGAYPKRETERWKKYATGDECEGHGAAIQEEQFC